MRTLIYCGNLSKMCMTVLSYVHRQCYTMRRRPQRQVTQKISMQVTTSLPRIQAVIIQGLKPSLACPPNRQAMLGC